MSIKSLRKSLSPGEEIISVTRKEMSLPITAKKISGLKEIISKSVSGQNFFLKHFSGIRSVLLASKPRALRDTYVEEGLPSELAKLGLQDRQWKMSLEKAFETIASSKAITEGAVRESVNKSKFSDKECHLVRYLLKRPELLQKILNGKMSSAKESLFESSKDELFNPALKKALLEIDQDRVFQWLRRRYREFHSKNQKPMIRKKRTYHLDPDMYSFIKKAKRSYVAVASLEARKRILIPLTNKNLMKEDFSGNIKVVLRHDGRVEVHRSINSVVKSPDPAPKGSAKGLVEQSIIAVDKGFTDLLHSTSGQKYGAGYGVKMAEWSDSLQKTNSGRARMHAQIKEYKKKIALLGDDPRHSKKRKAYNQKISQIQKNNLGSVKVNDKREDIKKGVQKEVGTAVNSFFKTEKMEVLAVERLDFDGSSFYGKRTNRLLKTWHKGNLQDALVKGAKTNRVRLEETNAAYTSQLCRACGAVDAKNRKGDKFACVHCKYKADANFNASLNIRDRFSDPEIGLYTPHKQVKEILINRHRLTLCNQGLSETRSPTSANNLRL